MDPTLLFLEERRDTSMACARHKETTVWEFFINAFLRKMGFSYWVKEGSLWDWFMINGLTHEDEVQDIRREILDFEEEFYKDAIDSL